MTAVEGGVVEVEVEVLRVGREAAAAIFGHHHGVGLADLVDREFCCVQCGSDLVRGGEVYERCFVRFRSRTALFLAQVPYELVRA